MAFTKLVQWLIILSAAVAIWGSYLLGFIKAEIPKECHDVIVILPLYLIIAFACISLAIIGYRVATFNDCIDAAEELKKQIQEAKLDLKKKGFKYLGDSEVLKQR